MNEEWIKCDYLCPARATVSVDDIPIHFEDGETLPLGTLYFCDHHHHKFEATIAANGYTVNRHVDYTGENKLVGSEN